MALPAAPIAGPAPFDEAIGRLNSGSALYAGSPGARFEAIGTVISGSYSDVVRVRVTGTPGLQSAFLKLYKADTGGHEDRGTVRARLLREFEATRRVHEHLHGMPGIGTLQPLACFPDLLVLVTAEARGETLERWLWRHVRWFATARALGAAETVLGRVGAWLKRFQALPPPDDRTLSIDAMRRYLSQRLSTLTAVEPRPRVVALTAAARARFEQLAAALDPALLRPVPIHADLSPGNVLVDDDRIVVLDFAMVKTGNHLHDLAHLLVQLERLKLRPSFRPAVVRRLQRALLAGFDPVLTPSDPLLQLMLLQHHACRLAQVELLRRKQRARSWPIRYAGWRQERWLESLTGPRAPVLARSTS